MLWCAGCKRRGAPNRVRPDLTQDTHPAERFGVVTGTPILHGIFPMTKGYEIAPMFDTDKFSRPVAAPFISQRRPPDGSKTANYQPECG